MVKKLTDDDVTAIVDEIEKRASQRFQLNVGKGVISFVWKGLLVVLLWLAVYGYLDGFNRLWEHQK